MKKKKNKAGKTLCQIFDEGQWTREVEASNKVAESFREIDGDLKGELKLIDIAEKRVAELESDAECYQTLIEFAQSQISALADELELECEAGDALVEGLHEMGMLNRELSEDLALASFRIEARDATIELLKEREDKRAEYIEYLEHRLRIASS